MKNNNTKIIIISLGFILFLIILTIYASIKSKDLYKKAEDEKFPELIIPSLTKTPNFVTQPFSPSPTILPTIEEIEPEFITEETFNLQNLNLSINAYSNFTLEEEIISENTISKTTEIKFKSNKLSFYFLADRYDREYRYENRGGQPNRITTKQTDNHIKIGELEGKAVYLFKIDDYSYNLFTKESENKVTWETSLFANNEEYDKLIIQIILSRDINGNDIPVLLDQAKEIVLSLKRTIN